MVRLQTSLLAITLATGSALASNGYYRRREFNNQVQTRLAQFPLDLAAGAAGLQSSGFVDEEDLFVRDLEVFEDLEARTFAKQVHQRIQNAARAAGAKGLKVFKIGSYITTAITTVVNVLDARRKWQPPPASISPLYHMDPSVPVPEHGHVHERRDLEDNEDLFECDLDVRELFGQEYDLLNERDIIDNEDLFVRDLDAEELFGMECDLWHEPYYYITDDLD